MPYNNKNLMKIFILFIALHIIAFIGYLFIIVNDNFMIDPALLYQGDISYMCKVTATLNTSHICFFTNLIGPNTNQGFTAKLTINEFLSDNHLALIIVLLVLAYIMLLSMLVIRCRYNKNLNVKNKVLGILLNSVPSGVVRCLNDENLTLIYYNTGYLDMLNKNICENTETLHLKDIIYNEDKVKTLNAIYKQLDSSDIFEIKFRAMKYDGGIIWVLCRGKKYLENNQQYLYCVMLNITEMIKLEQQQKIDQERYRIVAEASDSVIFEYNLKERTIYCTNKFTEKFGKAPKEFNMPDALYQSNFIHPDDMDNFKMLFDAFKKGKAFGSQEMRMLKGTNDYIWCEMRFSTIFDEKGLPNRAVGKIIDIDKMKKEREILIKANQKDSFTGLYNKKAVFELIQEYINNNGRQNHALFFIDIDNFKQVNDNFGHAIGDSILKEIAQSITSLFRESDIIGRIGGDEFVVLLKDFVDESFVNEKAKKLCKSINSIYIENANINVTTSIGIALFPKHGNTLTDIYDKADIALYIAKNEGRDTYKIFS